MSTRTHSHNLVPPTWPQPPAITAAAATSPERADCTDEPKSKNRTKEGRIGTNEPAPATRTRDLGFVTCEPCLVGLWQKGGAATPCRGWLRGVGDRCEPRA